MRARVEGVVQGVGFRPHVHRLASELGLGGFVLNDALGVLAEVEAESGDGDGDPVARFLERLVAEAPGLARVERVLTEELPPLGERAFAIRASALGAEAATPVAADAATCTACLDEMRDPSDRRHRYPFVNCTGCGPRFTIIRGVPYDRSRTTMAGFPMCALCRAEYEDPADRRFHAEPIACPVCGPRAWLADATGRPIGQPRVGQSADDPGAGVAAAAGALAEGRIVAVKGLGGFHLACRADDEAAAARLRARKRREEKPFALMVASLEAARELVELGPGEAELMAGRERPIVLARRHAAPAVRVAPSVAPGTRDLGLMLPYTPLHHLLLAEAGVPLVMTSGNRSDEPIAYRDEDALERLAGIADRFLLHDRPIHVRTDDSVVRAVAGRPPILMRRSRGYAPASLALPIAAGRPVLACGAELKSTFCLAKGRRAWVSHHIGDLSNWETLASFAEGVEHLGRLFGVTPAVVAHDLHPDLLSTRYAEGREGGEGMTRLAVQHHHAHLAACLAEHGETCTAVGAIFDGTGLGPDGTVWGGEILVGDLAGYARVAHLPPVRLPGGDRAAREPWRMAAAWLVAAGEGRPDGDRAPALPAALAGRVEPERWAAVCGLARTGLAAPLTTSAGRLFDAVAALAGVRPVASHEGQAAMELEAAADPAERGTYPMPDLDARKAIRAVARDAAAGVGPGVISARFHTGLAQATADACAVAAAAAGTELVVLSGGVFQNRRLLEATTAALAAAGLRPLSPVALPPNDGGLSYGQAAVAAQSSQ